MSRRFLLHSILNLIFDTRRLIQFSRDASKDRRFIKGIAFPPFGSLFTQLRERLLGNAKLDAGFDTAIARRRRSSIDGEGRREEEEEMRKEGGGGGEYAAARGRVSKEQDLAVCYADSRLQIIIPRAPHRTSSTYKSGYLAHTAHSRSRGDSLPDEMSYPIALGINMRLYEARGRYVDRPAGRPAGRPRTRNARKPRARRLRGDRRPLIHARNNAKYEAIRLAAESSEAS